MPDPEVTRHTVVGEVALWKYRDNVHYPGWHPSCDTAAGHSMIALIDRMLAAQHKSRKPIEVSTNPQLTAAPGISDTPIFAESFELRSDPRLPHEAWVWEQSSDTLIITMGHAMLEDLQLGIKNSLEGRGDYTLGDAPPLWFWWML